jgi:DNA-binding NarL/FixJ family response regulator
VLTQAIECVYYGLVVMSREVRTLLAEKLAAGNFELTGAVKEGLGGSSFDERDIQIICLIAKGMSNKAIAEQMNYSEGTVRNRVSNILSITGLNDRTQIALFAIKNRLAKKKRRLTDLSKPVSRLFYSEPFLSLSVNQIQQFRRLVNDASGTACQ